MNVTTLESIDDPRLAPYRGLSKRPAAKADSPDHFVCEGALLANRLIASEHPVHSVVVEAGKSLSPLDGIDPATDVFVLSADHIRLLAGYDFHRGYLACGERQPIEPVRVDRCSGLTLAAIGLTDMENFGSIMRSAAAFGVRRILISDDTVDPFSRRCARVSMGAVFGMEFRRLPAPAIDIAGLTRHGVLTLAATLRDDSISPAELPQNHDAITLIVGNEARGLPDNVERAAQERVRIAMPGQQQGSFVDSLNVSVATSILLYEIGRNHHQAKHFC